MTEQSQLFWLLVSIFGLWAVTATGACIWYQAERTHNRRLLSEIRKLNVVLGDLITMEEARKILARILSGRRA